MGIWEWPCPEAPSVGESGDSWNASLTLPIYPIGRLPSLSDSGQRREPPRVIGRVHRVLEDAPSGPRRGSAVERWAHGVRLRGTRRILPLGLRIGRGSVLIPPRYLDSIRERSRAGSRSIRPGRPIASDGLPMTRLRPTTPRIRPTPDRRSGMHGGGNEATRRTRMRIEAIPGDGTNPLSARIEANPTSLANLDADRSHSRRRDEPIFPADRSQSRRRSEPTSRSGRSRLGAGDRRRQSTQPPSE